MMARERNRRRGGFGKVILVVVLIAAVWLAAFWGMRTLIHRAAGGAGGNGGDSFQGRYDIDGYTAYVFESDTRGAMVLGDEVRYGFTYTMADGTLTMDFDDDSVTDTVFTYQLEGDTLTLTEGDEVFVLQKQ